MARLREVLRDWVVEVSALAFLGIAAWLISVNSALAVQKQRVENLEQRIDRLRSENREDHRAIMERLEKWQH